MEGLAANETVVESRQTLAECILTELEVGLTFLDLAATSVDRVQNLLGVEKAFDVLRTVDKLLSEIQPGTINVDAILPLRSQLAERLRDSGVDELSRK